MKDVAIFLYDKTGIMARPWAEAGYECYCVDIQHSIRKPRVVGNITFMWGDCRTWVPPDSVARRLRFLAAFPPCTHVTVADARDFRTKGTAMLRDSLEMFSAAYSAARWAGVPFMIENPIGKFSDHMQKPDYYFHPWHYGDPWTKNTCLWTGGGFVMPAPTVTDPYAVWPDWDQIKDKIHKMAPGDDREDKRSETPPGFARAAFESNGMSKQRAAA